MDFEEAEAFWRYFSMEDFPFVMKANHKKRNDEIPFDSVRILNETNFMKFNEKTGKNIKHNHFVSNCITSRKNIRTEWKMKWTKNSDGILKIAWLQHTWKQFKMKKREDEGEGREREKREGKARKISKKANKI